MRFSLTKSYHSYFASSDATVLHVSAIICMCNTVHTETITSLVSEFANSAH